MHCWNCKSVDQETPFCSFCGAKMDWKPQSPDNETTESQPAEDTAVLSTEPITNAPKSVDAYSGTQVASSDDGLELSLEVFAEKVSELAQPTEEYSDQNTDGIDAPLVKSTQGTALSGNTSVTAIAALISVFFIPILGLILGYLAKKEIVQSLGAKSGLGLAKSSIVLGWIFASIGFLFFVLIVAAASSGK